MTCKLHLEERLGFFQNPLTTNDFLSNFGLYCTTNRVHTTFEASRSPHTHTHTLQPDSLLCSAAKVALRNRSSTIIRLVVAPFLFILLVFIIDKAITSGNQAIAGTRLNANERHGALQHKLQLKKQCCNCTSSIHCQCNKARVSLLQRTACRSTLLLILLVQSVHVRKTYTLDHPAGTFCTHQTMILLHKQSYRAYKQTTLAG